MKRAFSITELVISMFILAIFLMVTVPLTTRKQAPVQHGKYICYKVCQNRTQTAFNNYANNILFSTCFNNSLPCNDLGNITLFEVYFDSKGNKVSPDRNVGDRCTFNLLNNVDVYSFQLIGGGSSGAAPDNNYTVGIKLPQGKSGENKIEVIEKIVYNNCQAFTIYGNRTNYIGDTSGCAAYVGNGGAIIKKDGTETTDETEGRNTEMNFTSTATGGETVKYGTIISASTFERTFLPGFGEDDEYQFGAGGAPLEIMGTPGNRVFNNPDDARGNGGAIIISW